MSGQPYRYHTDVNRFRNEYMETLGLQADINSLNLEANTTYKETGQLPPISQMKDSRTTTEILADSEKLKIDLIFAIAKVSSPQFGQLVVQSIMTSPLNGDNRLLTFCAQRIDDVINNLRKVYKYGIKGDSNDVQQFVNFISAMFNDKSSITANTKSFMNRYGFNSGFGRSGTSGSLSGVNEVLFRTGVAVKKGVSDLVLSDKYSFIENSGTSMYHDEISGLKGDIQNLSHEIIDFISVITKLIPDDLSIISKLEKKVIEGVQKYEGGEYEKRKGFEEVGSSKPEKRKKVPRASEEEYEDITETLYYYLDFLNKAIPNPSTVSTLIIQLNEFIDITISSEKKLINFLNTSQTHLYTSDDLEKVPLFSSTVTNFRKWFETLTKILEVIQITDSWDIPRLDYLFGKVQNLLSELQNGNIQQPQQRDAEEVREPQQGSSDIIEFQHPANYEEDIDEVMPPLENLDDLTQQEIEERDDISYIKDLIEKRTEQRLKGEDTDKIQKIIDERISDYQDKYGKEYTGSGILRRCGNGFLKEKKKRGRPKGSGIGIRKTFKDSIKEHSALDKGIMECPRYVKFGRYLVNNHKLNNEEIFALKNLSGGNIFNFPSTKISKNLSGVIKKMIGGDIPTYSDISKLSDPEKNYLHKISKKSNILEKFDIPAPSKDIKEKAIHQFEVMKGEIMAGNDNKDLIKKFKLHIITLSKDGTLPKREVTDILQTLLELGF